MTPIEILLTALAGLGLFFFGIKMVAHNLSAMAGDGLRRHLRRATATASGSALIGVLAGFITQSGRTTSFIMASFVQAGVIPVQRALPVVLWSNLGCALIVFIAVLPISLVALMMIGVAGGCIAFERPRPLLGAAHAVFGLAVMLFGLKMMGSGAPMLTQFEGFSAALAYMDRSPLYAFLLGLGLTVVAQSHMAIILISVPLAANGVLGFGPAVMLIYGAQAGSSVVTYLTGIHFRGKPRQVVIGQILYGAAGSVLFLLLYIADHALFGNGELLHNIVRAVSPGAGSQLAVVVLLFNLVTPLLLSALWPAYVGVCATLSPPRAEEDLGRPQFLSNEVRDNATTTLLLAEQEQLRLLRRLPEYFAYLRQDSRPRTGIAPATHHTAFASLGAHIRRFQSQLMSRRMIASDTEWLINQQQRQEALGTIEDACYELCELGLADSRADLKPVISSLAEATDAFVLTAIGAMANGDPVELDMLDRMTSDRGAAMEALRKRYLSSSESLPPEARIQILRITSIFERAAWSLGRFGRLLRAAPTLARAAERELDDTAGAEVAAGQG